MWSIVKRYPNTAVIIGFFALVELVRYLQGYESFIF